MDDKQIFDQIVSIIQKNRGETKIALDFKTSLSKDLGIDGQDAEEILIEYFKVFSIDITDFNFSDYFGEESFDIIGFFKRIITNKKYKDLTIGNLVEIAKKGAWEIN